MPGRNPGNRGLHDTGNEAGSAAELSSHHAIKKGLEQKVIAPAGIPQYLFPSLMVLVLFFTSEVKANDLLRTTTGAAALGSGGVSLLATDPLTAMSNNPALLVGQNRSFQVGGHAVLVDADFRSSLGESDAADRGPGLIPEAAFAMPVPDSRITLGALVMLRSALRAEFDFTDPPGTLNVSYKRQRHLSEYVVLEAAVGVGFEISDQLYIGANLGVLYNRNTLQAPYIFQTHPVLTGLKVLVDLEADDLAATAKVGARYKITENVDISLSFSAQTEFESRGKLYGNLSELGLGIQPDFNYRAVVKTATPATFSSALAWSVTEKLTAGLQVDWIYWSAAFDRLPLTLTKGSNGELNDFLASTSIRDTAPLNWDDQIGFAFGISYEIQPATNLRVGLGFDDVPVPESTFTPMTGAILDRSVSLGLSKQEASGHQLDVGYRYSQGSDLRVRQSQLAGGEYTNSRLGLALHTLFFSYRF